MRYLLSNSYHLHLLYVIGPISDFNSPLDIEYKRLDLVWLCLDRLKTIVNLVDLNNRLLRIGDLFKAELHQNQLSISNRIIGD